MPNGGSDCCGTCWFNKKNKGEVGYDHSSEPERDYCIIRSLEIENPFYTYCVNHPHRIPEKEEIPIGPVFTGNSLGQREIWTHSPDNEQVRNRLLELLAQIEEKPTNEYPAGAYLDETIIWQLGEFEEKRALPDLERIAKFDPDAKSEGNFSRSRSKTIALVKQAIEKIKEQKSQ